MLKKILVLILELALIVLLIFGIVAILDSFSLADEHETAPWCETQLYYAKDFVRYEQ